MLQHLDVAERLVQAWSASQVTRTVFFKRPTVLLVTPAGVVDRNCQPCLACQVTMLYISHPTRKWWSLGKWVLKNRFFLNLNVTTATWTRFPLFDAGNSFPSFLLNYSPPILAPLHPWTLPQIASEPLRRGRVTSTAVRHNQWEALSRPPTLRVRHWSNWPWPELLPRCRSEKTSFELLAISDRICVTPGSIQNRLVGVTWLCWSWSSLGFVTSPFSASAQSVSHMFEMFKNAMHSTTMLQHVKWSHVTSITWASHHTSHEEEQRTSHPQVEALLRTYEQWRRNLLYDYLRAESIEEVSATLQWMGWRWGDRRDNTHTKFEYTHRRDRGSDNSKVWDA